MRPQTSLLAYYDLRKTGKIGKQHAKIMDCLTKNPAGMTRNEIKNAISARDVCSITGRIAELRQKHMVFVAGTKVCSVTGRRVEAIQHSGNRNTYIVDGGQEV